MTVMPKGRRSQSFSGQCLSCPPLLTRDPQEKPPHRLGLLGVGAGNLAAGRLGAGIHPACDAGRLP